jgi:hypothetical protein
MSETGLPRFVVRKVNKAGGVRYFWQPPTRVLQTTKLFECRALGRDLAIATERAEIFNRTLDYWRVHGYLPGEGPKPKDRPPRPGSIDDMFATYKAHAPSRKGSFEQLTPPTKKMYGYLMERFANYELKDGRRVGQVSARDMDPPTVDRLYEALLHDKNGKERRRTTNHVMSVCRRAWNVAHRAKPQLFPKDNPFEKMGLDLSSEETVPATYAELLAFEAKAVEMGYPEVAFAARAAWDLLQRPTEVRERFAWSHYRPPDHPNAIFVGFTKTNAPVWKPLEDDQGLFYPELESLLKLTPRRAPLVCVHEVIQGNQKPTGIFKPYAGRLFSERVRRVADAAQLPKHITLAAFRHGGLTELGDAGLPDTMAQALSRHRQRTTLDRYIHRTDAQLISATRLRLAHRQGGNV